MLRFEFVAGNSRKFWQVWEPVRTPLGSWVVLVKFGRIGTPGQEYRKVFLSAGAALGYYDAKISEKKNKGYVNVMTSPGHAKALTTAKAKPKCTHERLHRHGANSWKCLGCEALVEFDKPAKAKPEEDTPQRARRFFDLGDR